MLVGRGQLMGAYALSLDAAPWREIHDSVMGGVSTGCLTRDEEYLVFSGALSLENNGGFASARRPVDGVPVNCDRVRIEVRGDGRTYQFRIRQDQRFDGVAWARHFETNGRWQAIEWPLAEFSGVFRGKEVSDAGPVQAERIAQVGVMLADRTQGPFRLEIRAIEFLEAGGEPHERS